MRFFASPDPENLCIKGEWGIGKTYAWNHYLDTAIRTDSIKLKKYAYVSLFGLQNLAELKTAIFENTKSIVSDNERGMLAQINWRKILTTSGKHSKLKSYAEIANPIIFSLVKDQIICIDDLERRGMDIRVVDVMGIVNSLKIEHGCKVVLLLNDNGLSDADRAEFQLHLEKVVDVSLRFNPEPTEAAQIAFPKSDEVSQMLTRNSTLLGIKNIRVLKKAEHFAHRLEELVGSKYPLLRSQLLNSAMLYAWARFEPAVAPPFEFLTNNSKLHSSKLTRDKTTEKEQQWQSILSAYGYYNTDELDEIILSGIKNGYFDEDKLLTVAKRFNETRERDTGAESFAAAWDMYHDSFDNNETEVMSAIHRSALKHIAVIRPNDLNSVVVFLKEFDRKEEAVDIIKKYIESHPNFEEYKDLDHVFWASDVKDPDVVEAFKTKKASIVDKRDPSTVLEQIAQNSGWNVEDTELVAKLTVDDFYSLFKNAKGRKKHSVIRGALIFKGVQGGGEKMQQIATRAREALERIGRESRINARRVSAHGISIPDDEIAKTPKKSAKKGIEVRHVKK